VRVFLNNETDSPDTQLCCNDVIRALVGGKPFLNQVTAPLMYSALAVSLVDVPLDYILRCGITSGEYTHR
jgi:hypothetical protein